MWSFLNVAVEKKKKETKQSPTQKKIFGKKCVPWEASDFINGGRTTLIPFSSSCEKEMVKEAHLQSFVIFSTMILTLLTYIPMMILPATITSPLSSFALSNAFSALTTIVYKNTFPILFLSLFLLELPKEFLLHPFPYYTGNFSYPIVHSTIDSIQVKDDSRWIY